MQQEPKKYSVVIIGGGITGCSIFHTLSKYTNVESIALIEKCAQLGQINSKDENNSQTLHFGDIEANYSFEKATVTKEASQMVVKYLQRLLPHENVMFSQAPKMLLAVGKHEVERLKERHAQFQSLFPESRYIEREEIEKLEPQITRGRRKNQPIAACHNPQGYVVDFGKLAEHLATSSTKPGSEIFVSTHVDTIKKTDSGYVITTNQGAMLAQVVVVSACAHSLHFAKSLGYGEEFSLLPVGGNFYTSSRKLLNGKVYTMQSTKIPFAGIHGDPILGSEDFTRFGPTANIIPFLERNNLKSAKEFVLSALNNIRSITAFFAVIFDKLLFSFLLKSLIYELPVIGPRAFAKLCSKIIPSVTHRDFKKSKAKAGVRPQLIDNRTKKLILGEVEIIGENILFNVTPSPGATACLQNAAKSVSKVLEFFDGKFSFDEARFDADFKE